LDLLFFAPARFVALCTRMVRADHFGTGVSVWSEAVRTNAMLGNASRVQSLRLCDELGRPSAEILRRR